MRSLFLFTMLLVVSSGVQAQGVDWNNMTSLTTCDEETGDPIIRIKKDSVGKRSTASIIAKEFINVREALSHKSGCKGWQIEQVLTLRSFTKIDTAELVARIKEDSVSRRYRMRCVKEEVFCIMAPIKRPPTRK